MGQRLIRLKSVTLLAAKPKRRMDWEALRRAGTLTEGEEGLGCFPVVDVLSNIRGVNPNTLKFTGNYNPIK